MRMLTAGEEALLIDKLRARFAENIRETGRFQGEVCHWVDKKALVGICHFLKSDPDLKLNYLVDVLGVDYAPASPRFEVIYHLYSTEKRHRLRIKVKADPTEAVPTVTGVWPAADWPEREVYDMYGIVFDQHPDLRRIYMAPDWQGFPLRKDYPLKGYKDEYNPFGAETEEDF